MKKLDFKMIKSYDKQLNETASSEFVKVFKKYWDAYFALLENIKKEFDLNNVEMTYNHINVHMVEK